jgi:hypothetical protein
MNENKQISVVKQKIRRNKLFNQLKWKLFTLKIVSQN